MTARTKDNWFLVAVILLMALIWVFRADAQTNVQFSATISNTPPGTTTEPIQGFMQPFILWANNESMENPVHLSGATIPAGQAWFGIQLIDNLPALGEVHYWLTSASTATLAVLGKHTAPPWRSNPITLPEGKDSLVVNFWLQGQVPGKDAGSRIQVPFTVAPPGGIPIPSGVTRVGNDFKVVCGPKTVDISVSTVPIPSPVLGVGIGDDPNAYILCLLKPVAGGTQFDCSRDGNPQTLCFPLTVVP